MAKFVQVIVKAPVDLFSAHAPGGHLAYKAIYMNFNDKQMEIKMTMQDSSDPKHFIKSLLVVTLLTVTIPNSVWASECVNIQDKYEQIVFQPNSRYANYSPDFDFTRDGSSATGPALNLATRRMEAHTGFSPKSDHILSYSRNFTIGELKAKHMLPKIEQIGCELLIVTNHHGQRTVYDIQDSEYKHNSFVNGDAILAGLKVNRANSNEQPFWLSLEERRFINETSKEIIYQNVRLFGLPISHERLTVEHVCGAKTIQENHDVQFTFGLAISETNHKSDQDVIQGGPSRFADISFMSDTERSRKYACEVLQSSREQSQSRTSGRDASGVK